ncbi:MAG: hypothetical protein M4579_004898 [Chaenotheca gracillima]|nr:MAG: hypothetical protein M4579_004898 [Chaenotheca gracillima]
MAAAVASAPGLAMQHRTRSDSNMISTLPDPRNAPMTANLARHVSAPPERHPDLSNEVTALSNKLIDAINHQTNLDDTLAATQHELDSSRDRVRDLQAQVKQHAQMVATGMLVKRTDYEKETIDLMTKVSEERKLRADADGEKKKMEQELENLTKELFEQANEMVSAARHERDATHRKNDQLKSQIKDMESLLASHQEQLAELKSVMQNMNSDRSDDIDSNANLSTAPTTPSLGHQDNLGKIIEALHLSPNSPGSIDVAPSNPTSFTHLLQPVLRTDLQSYDDFVSLLQVARASAPPSRVPSGSYGGLNVMGLGTLAGQPQSSPLAHSTSTGSNTSLSTTQTVNSSPATPSTPASSLSSGSREVHSFTPLKETRFYKRVLAEDIEPTLRLDTAPGLSWLARRTVLNGMCEGSLIVEPMPPTNRLYLFSCSLCGENRKGDKHARTHRFKTSDNDNAQRYPLCTYCLGRVRSACDFLGFLRMIRDGHWRTEGEESEKGAWEESVKLREQMFWARMGGGVVPAFVPSKDSPRTSEAVDRHSTEAKSWPAEEKSAQSPKDPMPKITEEDPFHSDEKRVSIGKRFISTPETEHDPVDLDKRRADEQAAQIEQRDTEAPEPKTEEPVIEAQSAPAEPSKPEEIELPTSPEPSEPLQALSPTSSFSAVRGQNRLSINIPGSFE